jgi:hypothetical protein
MAKFKKGESISVKKGVSDPDYPTIDISGWQGRIVEFDGEDEDGELYIVAWDSISLKSMDANVILDAIEEGIDYSLITLYAKDFEKASPRDKEKDVESALAELEEEFFWSDLGEQGERIRAVLKTAKSNSEKDRLKAWEIYLKSKLKFPMEVIFVGESEGVFKEGTALSLLRIDSVSDVMGVMGTAKLEKGNASVPLCELDTENENEANLALYDYCIWYANH